MRFLAGTINASSFIGSLGLDSGIFRENLYSAFGSLECRRRRDGSDVKAWCAGRRFGACMALTAGSPQAVAARLSVRSPRNVMCRGDGNDRKWGA